MIVLKNRLFKIRKSEQSLLDLTENILYVIENFRDTLPGGDLERKRICHDCWVNENRVIFQFLKSHIDDLGLWGFDCV